MHCKVHQNTLLNQVFVMVHILSKKYFTISGFAVRQPNFSIVNNAATIQEWEVNKYKNEIFNSELFLFVSLLMHDKNTQWNATVN